MHFSGIQLLQPHKASSWCSILKPGKSDGQEITFRKFITDNHDNYAVYANRFTPSYPSFGIGVDYLECKHS